MAQISFFDYMTYIPLFLSLHDNIIDNPLDMAEKYNNNVDNTSTQLSLSVRDQNPLGLPLRPEFLDAAKNIYPSGIPSGRPMLNTIPGVPATAETEETPAREGAGSEMSGR